MRMLFGLALVLAGCGGAPASFVSLTVPTEKGGSATETVRFEAKTRDETPSYPFFTDVQLTQELMGAKSARWGERPRLNVYLQHRTLDQTTTPVQAGEGPTGVGPVQGYVYVDNQSTGAVFEVAKYRYTGDANSPLEISGTLSSSWEGDEVKGEFSLRPDCSKDINASSGTFLCGDTGVNFDKDVAFIYGKLGARECDPALLKVFFGSVETIASNKVTYDEGRSVSVEGAELTYACSITRGGNNVICGAEKEGVSAQGCTWRAYALAAPFSVGDPLIRFWVGAVADDGCELPNPFCNMQFEAK